jgi:hypothetical protein
VLISYEAQQGYISTDPSATPVALAGGLRLSFQHTARAVIRGGTMHASTIAYTYQVLLNDRSLLEFHYHPDSAVKHCHLHARAVAESWPNFHKLHIATGRVAFEDVLLMLIDDFGVPARRGARVRLAESRSTFEKLQTWAGARPS